jgi:hypothetical protein
MGSNEWQRVRLILPAASFGFVDPLAQFIRAENTGAAGRI